MVVVTCISLVGVKWNTHVSIGLFVYLSGVDLYEFFLYFGYLPLVGAVVCK